MDEITNDENGMNMEEAKKRFEEMMNSGKMGAVPNLTGLPEDSKEKIASGVMHKATEALMATYISLGINGGGRCICEDGISGRKFELTFRTLKDNEDDNK